MPYGLAALPECHMVLLLTLLYKYTRDLELGKQKDGLYAVPTSYIGGAMVRLGGGGKQQEALSSA